jgi:hypothetical protein
MGRREIGQSENVQQVPPSGATLAQSRLDAFLLKCRGRRRGGRGAQERFRRLDLGVETGRRIDDDIARQYRAVEYDRRCAIDGTVVGKDQDRR